MTTLHFVISKLNVQIKLICRTPFDWAIVAVSLINKCVFIIIIILIESNNNIKDIFDTFIKIGKISIAAMCAIGRC